MNKITEFIDKVIIILYLTALFAGAVVSTSYDIMAEDGSKKYTNIEKSPDAESVSDIMDAYEFLDENERPADFENIKQYLDDFKAGKLDKPGQKDDIDEEAAPEDLIEENEAEQDVAAETEETVDESENKIEIDRDDWRLILVNKQNMIPEDYEVSLATINGSMQADERIIGDIYDMLNAASDDGINLMICSSYRTNEKQTSLFNNKLNKLMAQNKSYLESYKEGSMSVTPPGTSEHQTGLALDILTGSYTAMDDGFGETAEGIWLNDNSYKYGFILRYPKGKEDITGIIYEPWHFRYVGKEYAEQITDLQVCLEEFLSGDY